MADPSGHAGDDKTDAGPGYAGESPGDATRDYNASVASGDISPGPGSAKDLDIDDARVSYASCALCAAANGYLVGKNIERNYNARGRQSPDLSSGPLLNEEVEKEKPPTPALDFDKVKGQLTERGWTEAEVEEKTKGRPSGTSVDQRGTSTTKDGLGRNDPATVWGSRDGPHVAVNDRTKEVVQISDKNNPWTPDGRINWNE